MKLLTLILISCALAGCAGVSATVHKSTPYGDVTVRTGSDGKTDVDFSW